MIKVFFSYSWSQENLVTNVGDIVGRDYVIQDKFVFDAGNELDDEMRDKISKSDMFVFFLSSESLKSKNVHLELDFVASMVLSEEILFCPIYIDEEAKISEPWGRYDWLKKYLLTFTTNEKRIARQICQRIRGLSSKKIGENIRLFWGRGNDIAAITREYFVSVNKDHRALVISGLPRIGRKSLLVELMLKYIDKELDENYEPISVSLMENDSLDSLIEQLSEYSDKTALTAASKKDVTVLVSLLNELQQDNQKILIEDSKCLVQRDGRIVDWFAEVLKNVDLTDYTYFFIASEYTVASFEQRNIPKLQTYSLQCLSKEDMKIIFTAYAKHKKIDCSDENMKYYLDRFSGYPQLIKNVVDDIAKTGPEMAKKYLPGNLKFFDQGNQDLLDEIKREGEDIYQLTLLMSRFEFVSYDILCELLPEMNILDKLERMYCLCLTEQFGTEKQYYRLNRGLAEHISRNRIPLAKKYEDAYVTLGNNALTSIESEYLDLSERLFSEKEKIKNNPKGISSDLLQPSYVLKVIIELYHKGSRQDYENVIILAERLLNESQYNVYDSVIRSVKYWLCLASARNAEKKFFEQHVEYFYSQYHKNATFFFLKGFYARCNHDYGGARKWYEKSLECRNDSERERYLAKVYHELALVYIKLDDPRAIDFAKGNYEKDKENAYQIESYYRCLVRSEKPDVDILHELIEGMKKSHDQYKDVILDTFAAEYSYYIDGNYNASLQQLKTAIEDYPKTIQYPIDALKQIRKREAFNGHRCDEIDKILHTHKPSHDVCRFDAQ